LDVDPLSPHEARADVDEERIFAVTKRTEKLEWPLSAWMPMAGTRDLFGS